MSSSPDSIFRIGMIGLGYISTTHLQNFNAIDGVEIAAIADLDPERTAACAAQWNVARVFNDYHELLALQDLDLVVICLPNHLHAAVSIDALNAGQNVLCEKPMATTVDEAEAMVAAADANQCLLTIALNFRWQFFGPDIFYLKKLIEDGELGNIYYIRVHYLRRVTFPLAGYERWNLSPKESGGGVLIDLGPHMVDLAMWLLNDYAAQSVDGFIHNGLMKYASVDDFASGSLRMQSGSRIQLDLAWNSHNEPAWQIDVYGEAGGAVIQAQQPPGQAIKRFTVENQRPAIVEPGAVGTTEPEEATLQEHVVRRMLAGERPDCTAERALMVMRAINAWYESSADGRNVTL